MAVAPRSGRPHLQYELRNESGGFALARAGAPARRVADAGELLLEFERDAIVALQGLRRDLFFLHAAALAAPDGAVLFVGDSGAGKSTLAWALVQHGVGYLSDELAPVDPHKQCVLAYPRALCLKDRPPEPDALPADTLETSRGLHVAVDATAGIPAPRGLHAIFFLVPGAASRSAPVVRPASAAEASARLLANALNPAAHPADGLDAAVAIAESVPCFELEAAGLGATCELVREALADARFALRPLNLR
jgi:hypothetical protein